MGFLTKMWRRKKEVQAVTAESFWKWFTRNEATIFSSISKQRKPEVSLQHILDQVQSIHPNIFALIGMLDPETAELVLTADGDIKTVVFIDDIISIAPHLPRWKFTSLKSAIGFETCHLEMYGLNFSKEKLKFYPAQDNGHPDDIDLTVVHEDYNEENHHNIGNGTLVFLDNAIGELKMITQIDNIGFSATPRNAELIPIEKLNDYLLWREKEFVEKYDEVRYDTSKDEYTLYEAEDKDHNLALAIINQQLLKWEHKSSHPWMLTVETSFKGDLRGMPDNETFETMSRLENELLDVLKDMDGYLYLGRNTYKDIREVYFACREFRNSSRLTAQVLDRFKPTLNVSYSIFKDKYWRELDRFIEADI